MNVDESGAPPARSVSRWVLPAVPLAWLAAHAALFLQKPPIISDTLALIGGARAALQCLDGGPSPCPAASYFPIFQYIPTSLLIHAGSSDYSILYFFLCCSVGAAALVLAGGTALLGQRSPIAASVFAIAMMSGYFCAYINTTYNETIAAAVLLCLAAAVMRAAAWPLTLVLALAAGLTKEIAAPFALVLALAPALRDPAGLRRGLASHRHVWGAVLVGLVVAQLIHVAFNEFRFGTPRNLVLLDPLLQVPNLGQALIHLASLWFSPNGGLVFFAPVTCVVVVWGASRSRFSAVIFGLLLALTGGFALWFSPLGWWGWGPRLCLPWLPAFVWVVLWDQHAAIDAPLRRWFATTSRALAGVAALALVGGAHALITARPEVLQTFFLRNGDCSPLVAIEQSVEAFYGCHNALLFPRETFVLVEVWRAAPMGPVALYAAALGALIVAGRAGRSAPPREPSSLVDHDDTARPGPVA